jgi:exopolyphosphatase/guanosine-5'-triphosphate,3'-diphosphate pyrophosphatase
MHPFGLLELGSNSLKLYLVKPQPDGGHTIKAHKVPWRVAHDYFSVGRLEEKTTREMVAAIRALEHVSEGLKLAGMIAVATGVFRELKDIGSLADRIKSDAGLRLRVITGEDEARLMACGFPRGSRTGSVLLCDLGGATTEWARLVDGEIQGLGSLPLGAIRNEYAFRRWKGDTAKYLALSRQACDSALEAVEAPAGTAVLATGGTAKAAAACAGKDVVPAAELSELVQRVASRGPPDTLKPERRAVLLPGLVILERVVVHCGAPALEHTQTSVRDGMAERLVHLLGTYRREDLHATLLLYTRYV